MGVTVASVYIYIYIPEPKRDNKVMGKGGWGRLTGHFPCKFRPVPRRRRRRVFHQLHGRAPAAGGGENKRRARK